MSKNVYTRSTVTITTYHGVVPTPFPAQSSAVHSKPSGARDAVMLASPESYITINAVHYIHQGGSLTENLIVLSLYSVNSEHRARGVLFVSHNSPENVLGVSDVGRSWTHLQLPTVNLMMI